MRSEHAGAPRCMSDIAMPRRPESATPGLSNSKCCVNYARDNAPRF